MYRYEGVRVCSDGPKFNIFHSKLLLENSASFTSSRMKDLCQKMEGKTNFLRHLKQFDGLT